MYREYKPSAALAPFVECFWSRELDGQTSTTVLPDGCVDILFDDGKPYVVGTMTRPLLVARRDRARIVAVRFRAGGAFPFFGVPMSELTDERVELAAISRLPAADVWDVTTLDSLLRTQLSKISAPNERVTAAVTSIQASGGRVKVEALSRKLGVSRQHLNRLFERHVGVGVKFFSRVERFQSLRVHAARSSRPRWAELALEHGFYDQAHLVSEFKALAGAAPSRFF
jgi:AraC-like DNA-binding protein